MKKIILVFLLVIQSCYLFAQVKVIDQCDSVDVYKFSRGDTVMVSCDTIYTISNGRYHEYELMRFILSKNNNLLFSTLNEMKANYEREIKQEKHYSAQLKLQFDKLDNQSQKYITTIDKNLQSAMSSLNEANTKIDSADKGVKETLDILKKEKKMQLGKKLLWGTGGLVIGIAISTTIILLAGN